MRSWSLEIEEGIATLALGRGKVNALELFVFPKPLVAALNGHTIAGGCMLALACDRRLMARERGKISLNEITFGASVFAGSVEMLTSLVGRTNAEVILFSGAMFDAAGAHELGLVDQVLPAQELLPSARAACQTLAAADSVVFRSIKRLIRGPIAERMRVREPESIREFVKIWYSESTRRQLEGIQIRR